MAGVLAVLISYPERALSELKPPMAYLYSFTIVSRALSLGLALDGPASDPKAERAFRRPATPS